MRIHLPAYPPGLHRIDETLTPGELDLDPDRFGAPIHALLQLDRHDPYLQFEFTLSTLLRLECDRCAESFDSVLAVKSPMLYVLGRGPQPAPDDPEIVYVPVGTVDLDITSDLRDFLLLAIPERRLCSEDCKGLCPRCGANLNEQECNCRLSSD